MMYMTGENDTLNKLREGEGYTGSLASYEIEFAKRNPELCKKFPFYKQKLPANVPVVLVTLDVFDPLTRGEIISEMLRYSPDERATIRQLQEDGNGDAVTQVGISELMEGLQFYAKGFRQFLKTPLILTPWEAINKSLTDKSLFKIISESSSRSSHLLSKSPYYNAIDQLYKDMMDRDDLNRRWALLAHEKSKEATILKRELEKQVEELTIKIRKQLPEKIDDAISKYVSRRFTPAERKAIRRHTHSGRQAGRFKLRTTNLDVFNKTGLSYYRTVISATKKIGVVGSKYVGKFLNWGSVAYDTVEAYRNNDKFVRTFLAGAASVVVATEVTAAAGGTAALGGIVLGSLVGDVAFGATLLVCSPIIGWGVLLVAGVAVGGYISYKTKEFVESVYDAGEIAGTKMGKAVEEAVTQSHDQFKEGWIKKEPWIPGFYGF